jgi:hypothetical protein
MQSAARAAPSSDSKAGSGASMSAASTLVRLFGPAVMVKTSSARKGLKWRAAKRGPTDCRATPWTTAWTFQMACHLAEVSGHLCAAC